MSDLLGGLALFLFLVLVVGVAVWLLAQTVIGLFGRADRRPPANANSSRRLQIQDRFATCRMLDHLLYATRISRKAYDEIRDVVDEDFRQDGMMAPLRASIALSPAMAGDGAQASKPNAASAAKNRGASVRPAEKRPDLIVTAQVVEQPSSAVADDSPSKRPVVSILPKDTSSVPVGPGVAQRQRAAAAQTPAPVHPLEADERTAPERVRRSFYELLHSFMEEKNIRWGELVSGLLIIGSAIGLIISLQDGLRAIPYFTEMLAMAFTGAIHVAGIYTLRRWKIETTSRGVLTIGLLLIPLNLIAACILPDQGEGLRPMTDPFYLTALVVGVIGFSAMAWFSSQHLIPRHGWTIFVVVQVVSLSQLVINRVLDASSQLVLMNVMAIIPIVAFAIGVMGFAWCVGRDTNWTRVQADRLYLVLGLGVFSLATAFGLILYRVGLTPGTLSDLAPAIAMAVQVVIAAGLIVQSRLIDSEATTARVIATALIVLGTILAGATMVAAGGNPALLLSVATANLFGSMAITWLHRRPHLVPMGVVSLAIIVLVLSNQLVGRLDWNDIRPIEFIDALMSGWTALASFGIACGLLLLAFRRRALEAFAGEGFESFQRMLIACGVSVGVVSGLVTLAVGVSNASAAELHICTALLFCFTAGFVAISAKWRAVWIDLTGAVWLLIALFQLLGWNPLVLSGLQSLPLEWSHICALALVSHGISCLFAGQLLPKLLRIEGDPMDSCRRCWFGAGLATVLLAVPFSFVASGQTAYMPALILGFAALVWSGAGILLSSSRIAFAAQLIGLASVLSWTLWGLNTASWSQNLSVLARLDWCFATSALWFLGWSWISQVKQPWSFCIFSQPVMIAWRRVLVVAFTGGIAALQIAACGPGIAAELGFADRFANSAPDVWQIGAWLSMAIVVVWWLTERSLANAKWLTAGLTAAAAIPLVRLSLIGVDELAVASCLRWLFAAYGIALIASTAMFPSIRKTLQSSAEGDSKLPGLPIVVAMTVTSLPIIFVTTLTAGWVLFGESLAGPLADSWFDKMGMVASYSIPLAATVATFFLIGGMIRNQRLLFGGAILQLYTVSLLVVLGKLMSPAGFGPGWYFEWVQWSATALAVYGLAWLGLNGRIIVGPDKRPATLSLTIAVPVVALLVLSLISCFQVVRSPGGLDAEFHVIGYPLGFLATLICAGVATTLNGSGKLLPYRALFSIAAVTLVGNVVSLVDRLDVTHQLWAYWTLAFGLLACLTAINAITQIGRLRDHNPRVPGEVLTAGTLLAVVIAFLGIRAIELQATQFWFAIALLAGNTVLVTWMAQLSRREYLRYIGAVLMAVIAGYIWKINPWTWSWTGVAAGLHMIWIAVAAYALYWQINDLVRQGADRKTDSWPEPLRMERVCVISGTLLFALLVAGQFLLQAANVSAPSLIHSPLAIVAILIQCLVVITGQRHQAAECGLSLLGFGAAAVMAVVLRFTPDALHSTVVGGASLSVYLFGTSWVYSYRDSIFHALRSYREPQTGANAGSLTFYWPVFALVIGSMILVTQCIAVLTCPDRTLRYVAAFSPLFLGVASTLFSPHTQGRFFRPLSLACFALTALLVGWADLTPSLSLTMVLAYTTRAVIVLALLVFLHAVVVPRVIRVGSDWAADLKHHLVALVGITVATMAVTICLEGVLFEPGLGAPVGLLPLMAMTVMLVVFIVALIVAAVRPNSDPLSLSERGRQAYVYAAQVVAAVAVLQVFLCEPQLFSSEFRLYWPYAFLLIAFAGIGVGEWLRRAKIDVVGQPLMTTGAFLPLIPAIGMWMIAHQSSASLVYFLGGLIYLAISLVRGSTWSGLVAALFANLAIWSFYTGWEDLSIFRHPQLWLIPPALSVLIAAQINQRLLSKSQLTAIRYCCILVIYLSSAGEILIQGVGDRLWPPLVLASISVLGVMLGILLQIRAYLYLGSGFLFLSMVAMVSHAHQSLGHVWPWWTFGICLGLAILAMFAFLEKKRPQVRLILGEMRRWEA